MISSLPLAQARDAADDWSPEKVERTDFVEHVAGQIKARIVDNTFRAASSLPGEMRLAEQFGVSRTVVREALRVLSTQGLVELSHGRPAAIKHPDHHASVETFRVLFKRSSATPLDLIEVREVLEGEIAALAAERAGSDDIEALEKACQALREAASPDELVQADVLFHLRLAEATGNPCFVQLIQTLRALFLESVRTTRQQCSRDVHDSILAAVKARSPERARKAMLEHIATTRSLLRDGSTPGTKQQIWEDRQAQSA